MRNGKDDNIVKETLNENENFEDENFEHEMSDEEEGAIEDRKY